jgi:hypothetical protein
MAVQTEQQRFDAWADLMRRGGLIPAGLTKQQIRAAYDAADVWRDANASSYNLALPLAFRNAANAKQKAGMLMLNLVKEYEITP